MTGSFAIASFPIASAPSIVVTSGGGGSTVPITVGLPCFHGQQTAGDVIRRALQAILVTGADSPLTADEYQDGLDALNDYMASLESNGVRLGYTPCCTISDPVTVPAGAIRGIVANLAIDIASDYGGRVSQALIKRATESENVLYNLGVNIIETSLPENFPYGSTYPGEHVYWLQGPSAVISMAGNRLVTDITTVGQAEQINGVWTAQNAHKLRPDVGGRITNVGEGFTANIYAEFNIKASGTTSGGVVAIIKNQTVAIYAEDIALSTTPVSVLLEGTVDMEAGDYLLVYVADAATTRDITVIDSLVKVTGCRELSLI